MAQSPWSIKGIDPEARVVAKSAARKEGMTLGEWLNRVILEDGERPAPSVWDPDSDSYSDYRAEHGENSGGALRAAIDRLTERVNRAERLTENGQQVLQSLIGTDQGKTHRTLDELAEHTATLERRLDIADAQLSQNSKRSVSAEDFRQKFEGLATELASAILATRNQFTRELENLAHGKSGSTLGDRVGAVDEKLRETERKQSKQLKLIGTQLELLAGAMKRHVETTTQNLEDRVARLEEMTGTPETGSVSDQISKLRDNHATAIERIGEEVSRLGQALATRIEDVETRSAEAIQATGEKVADVVEKLDVTHAAPVRNLEARLAESEERTAQELARAMETVDERFKIVQTENAQSLTPVQKMMAQLANRLKAIETRALEEGLDLKADFPDPLSFSHSKSRPEKEAPRDPIALSDRSTHTPSRTSGPLKDEPAHPTETSVSSRQVQTDDLTHDDDALFEPLDFDPEPERDFEADTPLEHYATKPESRDDDASARSRGDNLSDTAKAPATPKKPVVIGATADADFLATMRARAREQVEDSKDRKKPEQPRSKTRARRSGSETTDTRKPRAKTSDSRIAKAGASLQDGRILLAGTSVLSFAIIGVAAALLLADAVTGTTRSPEQVQPADLGTLFSDEPVSATPEATVSETPSAPISDIRTSSEIPLTTPVQADASQASPVARYQLALEQISDGRLEEASALIRRAAEQGLPVAQYRYGLMLERGEGVTANRAEALEWMTRAAENGNHQAMQMAGMMYIMSDPTAANHVLAARWFEEAARHGMVTSQYNLALLYKDGFGVEQSPGDAYAWFLIAEANGDSDAGDYARTLRPDLTDAQRNEAETFAQSFEPSSGILAAQGDAEALAAFRNDGLSTIREAQELLVQLGYDIARIDGSVNSQTREAIMRYQSEQGLIPTGMVDATLLSSLEQYASQ